MTHQSTKNYNYGKKSAPQSRRAFSNIITAAYARKPSRTPAATAEPITPATFGPIACISK